jgi:hypothetical protein
MSRKSTAKAAAAAEETPPVIITPQPPLRVYVQNGGLVAARSNRFFHGAVPIKNIPGYEIIPKAPPTCVDPAIRRITYDEWCQFCAFHRWSVATYSAETILSHLLTRTGEHITLPFHQQVFRGAMTISVDYTTPENTAILDRLQNEHGVNIGDFHGTTHNHVRTSAFASGTDKDDEENKQGWHFTIGHCDKPELSLDGRVRMKFNPTFDEEGVLLTKAHSELFQVSDWSTLVDIPHVHPDMPPEMRKVLSLFWLARCPDNGFPEEWKDYVTLRASTVNGFHNRGPNWWKSGEGAPQQQQWDDSTWPTGHHGRKTTAGAGTGSAPAGTTGGTIATVPVNGSASTKGHLMTDGSFTEEDVDIIVEGKPGLTKEQYREFHVELMILDILASNLMLRTDALKALNAIKDNNYMQLYGTDCVAGRALTQMMDSPTTIPAPAIQNVLDLLTVKPGYMVSISPSESPHNRQMLLDTFMAPVEV